MDYGGQSKGEQLFTLDEFTQDAAVQIQAFAAATICLQGRGEEGFVGEQFERRTRDDWWRELAAYRAYVELSEEK